jgi:hypothetical protein
MMTTTDGMRRRLAKLEKLAGKGPCPGCRLFCRRGRTAAAGLSRLPDDPSIIVTSLCGFCGTPWRHDLSGYPEELREVARLGFVSTLEDTYSSPRAWAAQRWMGYWAEARRQHREMLRAQLVTTAPGRPAHKRRGHVRWLEEHRRERGRQKDLEARRYVGLLLQARALIDRRRRLLELRYGESPFPELEARLKAVGGPDYGRLYRGEPYGGRVRCSPMHEIEKEAVAWLMCAELERVLLGEVTAHTAGRQADCEERARAVVAAARADHERAEEESRLREEERRRQEEERQRRFEAEREEARRREAEERKAQLRRAQEALERKRRESPAPAPTGGRYGYPQPRPSAHAQSRVERWRPPFGPGNRYRR